MAHTFRRRRQPRRPRPDHASGAAADGLVATCPDVEHDPTMPNCCGQTRPRFDPTSRTCSGCPMRPAAGGRSTGPSVTGYVDRSCSTPTEAGWTATPPPAGCDVWRRRRANAQDAPAHAQGRSSLLSSLVVIGCEGRAAWGLDVAPGRVVFYCQRSWSCFSSLLFAGFAVHADLEVATLAVLVAAGSRSSLT
jgi:hypothetical protein